MATERTVDVETICGRPLRLFVNGHHAWDHMRRHGLGMEYNGEEQGWGLLLPALEAELIAGQLEELRKVARATNLNPGHARLGPIYAQFLDSIKQGVERAMLRLNWYWEEAPDSNCRWSAFGHEGILAHLDENCVHTGYLPEDDPSKWSGSAGKSRFRLFEACRQRVQAKYNYYKKSNRIESIQPALKTILQSGLTEAQWAALA